MYFEVLNLYQMSCVYLVAQSCLTLCDIMDCSPPGSSVRGDSPGKNTGVGHYQRNANQNHNEVPSHASQDGCYPKVYKH